MKVHIWEHELWEKSAKNGFSDQVAKKVIESAAATAAERLPSDFRYTNIIITPTNAENVIPESGEVGFTRANGDVTISFDASIPYGVAALEHSLSGSVFHELVHVTTFAHDAWRPSALFGAVTEGLATVFERDYADKKVPWGEYKSDEVMREWYHELEALDGSQDKNTDYFISHPDGRRWIVYKTGVWIVDRLIANGEDLFDLMKVSHTDILNQFSKLP